MGRRFIFVVWCVCLAREFEARGYAAGTSVLVEELDGGELRLMPTDHVRDRIRSPTRRAPSGGQASGGGE